MSMIQLKSDYPHNHISVPRVFIDKYMADANGEFVKVYLFLLRCMGSSASSDCSISAIADHFNYTEKDILRALKYWEKVGVLSIEVNDKNQMTGVCFKDLTGGVQHTTSSTITVTKAPVGEKISTNITKNKTKKTQGLSPISTLTNKTYTLDEKKAFSEDPEVAELLFIMESYLKKPLSSIDMETVFFWLDELNLSRELVEYLVESSIDENHTNSIRFMNKRAIEWAENGITTVEQAKLFAPKKLSHEHYAVLKALGITNRTLIDSEINLINKWIYELGFSLDIIQEACRRTIAATSRPNFEYTNTILTEWHKKKVHTLKDIASIDASHIKNKSNTKSTQNDKIKRNSFNNFSQRKYDSGELEKILLTTSVQ